MAIFEKSIGHILENEGGYVNHPNDPGGATNYGVSLRFLKETDGDGDFDNDGDVDVEDIRNMDVEDAMAIYKKYWWDRFRYGMIHDQTIATKIFDMSVNMGAKRAHTLVQTAINVAFDAQLTEDGILGPATFQVINAIGDGDEEQILLDQICEEQWGFYQRLIAKNPKFRVFAKGWQRRAFAVSQANSVRKLQQG
jgi:lysozyme family protein